MQLIPSTQIAAKGRVVIPINQLEPAIRELRQMLAAERECRVTENLRQALWYFNVGELTRKHYAAWMKAYGYKSAYGAAYYAQLAQALDMALSVLYQCVVLAETYDAATIRKLLRTHPHLSASHVVTLSTVHNPEQRRLLEQRIGEDPTISVRQLDKLIKDEGLRSHAHGLRSKRAPKSAADALEQIEDLVTSFLKDTKTVWFGKKYNLLNHTATVAKTCEQSATMLVQTAEALEAMAESASNRAMELREAADKLLEKV